MIERFLQKYLAGTQGVWSGTAINALADASFPDQLFHSSRDIAKADINMLWAHWFVQSFLPVNSTADLIQEVQRYVSDRHGDLPAHTRNRVEETLLQIVAEERERQSMRRRQRTSRNDRDVLLGLSGSPPRCASCGHKFCQEAIDAFLQAAHTTMPKRHFVDFVKPAGLFQEDFRIEIDHRVPVSKGGLHLGNLQLLCGWCNSAKRDFTNIYECGVMPIRYQHHSRGVLEIPQSFWVVRKLMASCACEHKGPEDCLVTSRDDEMVVATLVDGAMTPPNLAVFCSKHDPFRNYRLVTPKQHRAGVAVSKGAPRDLQS